MKKQKCAVLFSGGLDSRLAIKISQEKYSKVTALHFKLPFSKNVEGKIKNFCKEQKVKLKIFDCTKRKLMNEYIEVIKNHKYNTGSGVNPCVDCKIFMFKKAKDFADKNKIKFIISGEVSGQRPISQTEKSIKIIEEESDLKNKILRPIDEIAKGRRRDAQISLAKKFKISYPSPAGGCLLCEKALKNKFKTLLNNNLISEETLPIINLGRHFWKNNCWFVVGRNEKENEAIEESKSCINSEKGKPAVYFNKKMEKKFAEELQNVYRTGASEKERKKFEKYKL